MMPVIKLRRSYADALRDQKEPKDTKAIPDSVLRLLSQSWKVETDYSAFDSVWSYEDRRSDPSYYFSYKGKPCAASLLSYEEAKDLIGDEIVGPARVGVSQDGNRYYAINEHAKHALFDFCGEVYAAWEKYKDRLAKIEAASK